MSVTNIPKFTIPMRGNEVIIILPLVVMVRMVYDPHEG